MVPAVERTSTPCRAPGWCAALFPQSGVEIPPDVGGYALGDYLRWLHARPREWEDRAIAMVIDMVEQTGCPAHIVHLSSATALP